MSGWMFWKIFGDACLYFSAVSVLPALFPHQMSFLVPALLCGVSAAGAAVLHRQGKGRLRFICLLLPMTALAAASSVMEFLILLPVLLYCGAVIWRCEFYLEYYEFRESFLRSLGIWACAILVVAVFHGLEMSSGGNRILDTAEPLTYGLLWGLSGILLCRKLRLGAEAEHRPWTVRRAVLMLGLSGGAAVCFVGLERFLQVRSSSLSQLVASFLTMLIGLPGQLFGRIMDWVLSLVDKGYLEYAVDKEQQIHEMEGSALLPTEQTAEETVKAASGFPWWLAVLVLAAFALALVFMLKRFRPGAPTVSVGEKREKLEESARKDSTPRRSNRSMVRKYYRSFLKAEKKRGMRLHPSQTSEEILANISAETDREAAEALRQLYLSARYDESREVTRQQVDAAREALKRLRESP